MRRIVWLLLLILVAPLVSWGVASVVQVRLDSDARGGLGGTRPGIAEMCARSGGAATLDSDCAAYRTAGIMGQVAATTAVVGVALVAAIWVTGLVARHNRLLLLVAFVFGLPITNLALLLMLLAQGLMVVVVLYLAQDVLIGKTMPLLTIAAGGGAVIGALALLRSMLTSIKTADIEVTALGLEKGSQPKLWSLIDKVAAEIGSSPPKYVVVGLDPTFFVTEERVQCLNGRSNGRILFLSLPMCRILTPSELAAVIGHELGHFRGGDLWFSQRFYPIYQGTARSLAALETAADTWVQAIALFPSLTILGLFFESFATAERSVSRTRELAADRCGVDAASTRDLAVALGKLTAFSREWERGQLLLQRQARLSRSQVHNVSKAFAESARQTDPAEAAGRLTTDSVPHPLDSHPPLAVRLSSLGLTFDDVRDAILNTTPEASAVALIDGYEYLEDELSTGLFERLNDR